MSRRIPTFLLLLLLVAGAAYGAARYLRPGDTRRGGDADAPAWTLARRDIVARVDAIGIVVARESRTVSAPYSGKLIKLLPEGTFVEKGQEVAWLDTAALEQQLETSSLEHAQAVSEHERAVEERRLLVIQQQLDIESAQAQVGFNELRLEDARRAFEDQRKLVEQNLASQNSLEEKRLGVLQAELTLRESRIALRRTEERQASDLRVKDVEIERAKVTVDRRLKELEDTRRSLERNAMTAPSSGFLSYLFSWRGQRTKIQEGDDVWEGRGVLEIPDANQMIAAAPVNELDINRVALDQRAEVRVAALPDETFHGKVAKKGGVPLTAEGGRDYPMLNSGLKLFEVEVEFDQQDPRFRQNMTAYVTIQTGTANGVLAAPFEAVYRAAPGAMGAAGPPAAPAASAGDTAAGAPRDGGAAWFVLLRTGGAEPRKVPVRLGLDDGNFVELRALDGDGPPSELAEGSELLLRDPAQPHARL